MKVGRTAKEGEEQSITHFSRRQNATIEDCEGKQGLKAIASVQTAVHFHLKAGHKKRESIFHVAKDTA